MIPFVTGCWFTCLFKLQIVEEWVDEEVDENGEIIADKIQAKKKNPLKISIRAQAKWRAWLSFADGKNKCVKLFEI